MSNGTSNGKMSNGKRKSNSMHHEFPVPHTTTPPPDYTPRYGRLLIHAGCAGMMIQGFMGLNGIAGDKAVPAQYGGFFQYLTIIGYAPPPFSPSLTVRSPSIEGDADNRLMASIIVMLLSTINDLLPAVRPTSTIKRSLLLFAMPVEIVIASIYWTLVFTKPELMFPPLPSTSSEPSSSSNASLLFRIPLWMDLSMHLLPAIALLFEFFVFERRYDPPASTRGALLLAVCFGTAYSVWVEHCATINGKFPYPFLDIMDGPQRVGMYVFSTVLSLAAFWTLNALHR